MKLVLFGEQAVSG